MWLLCLALCLGLTVPAMAADNTGTEIRLLQTEGTVKVTSTSGKTYTTRDDMRLYNGYIVTTSASSYAWITLDSTKAVKLDASSSLEVRRSGRSLELLLKSGNLFFNVTAPLKKDEKLNIRTSTMVTGVRGTAGWIRQIDAGHSQVGILEGEVICCVTNPDTGASRTLVVCAGQIGDFQVYEAYEEGEGAEAQLLKIGSIDDISAFILLELLKDTQLLTYVQEITGLDFSGLTEEAVRKRLAEEEEEARKKLIEIESRRQQEVISKDPLWEGPGEGGGAAAVTLYDITWIVGGQSATYRYEEGVMPGYPGSAPAGMEIIGWTPPLEPASRDITYTAVLQDAQEIDPGPQPQVRRVTVTWNINGDRTTEIYEVGQTPEYKGDEPVREGTAQYTYTFTGWSPAIAPLQGSVTYVAQFSRQPKEYTVTWNINGETVGESCAYGDTPSHETPVLDLNDGFTYTFVGWSDGETVYGEDELPAVTGDVTYTAVFDGEGNDITVIWSVNGTETEESYTGGEIPSYKGATPTRETSAQYTYTFAGWSDGTSEYSAGAQLPALTGNVTYTAVFSTTVNEYKIVWVDGDGDTLLEQTLPYGETPVYTGVEPTKEGTAKYTYVFSGSWSPDVGAVHGNVTYTAQFEEKTNEYTITWVDENGDVLDEQTLPYGETPVYGGPEPTKEATNRYTYAFKGWTPGIAVVTWDATYTAQYEATEKQFTVTWLDGDGNELDSVSVTYGETPVYEGPEPTKEATAQYTYTFNDSWSPAVGEVTGDVTYTAQFDSEVNEYTVLWLNYDGTELETDENVPFGTVPAFDGGGKAPARDSAEPRYVYSFAGWSSDDGATVYAPGESLPGIEGDVTYTAQFDRVERTFTVTWVDGDGNTIETDEDVAYGAIPSFDRERPPEKTATATARYTFIGWLTPEGEYYEFGVDLPEVTGDVTYTASFSSETLYAISVTDNGNGTLTAPASAAEGDTVELTATVDTGFTADIEAVLATYDDNGTAEPVDVSDVSTGDTFKFEFVMPAGPVTIEFLPYEKLYTITTNASAGDGSGSVEIVVNGFEGGTAYYQDEITLSLVFDRTEALPGVPDVTTASGDPVDLGDYTDDTRDTTTIRTYTFAMPADDLSVTPSFMKVYAARISVNRNRLTVSASGEGVGSGYFPAGAEVTLAVQPAGLTTFGGEVVPTVTGVDDGEAVELARVSANTYTFTMPEQSVTVTDDGYAGVTVRTSDSDGNYTPPEVLTIVTDEMEEPISMGDQGDTVLLVRVGQAVSVHVVPGDSSFVVENDYGVSPLEVTLTDGTNTDGTYTFTMPATGDVNLELMFSN